MTTQEASTPSSRSAIARLGAYSLHAQYDSRETTKNGRAVFLSRFEREVDPDGRLEPAERARRAAAAKRAYFIRLGLRSAKVRRQRRERKAKSSP